MAERKLVVVKDNGILPELGGIGGPILTPTRIPISNILKLINNKRHVFECYPNDPRNESLWVELTNANYKSDNFNKVQEPAPTADPDPVVNPDDESQNPDPTVNPETDPEQTQQSTDDEEQKKPEVDNDPVTNPVSNPDDGVQNPEPEAEGEPEHVTEETKTVAQQTKSSKKKKK